MSKKLILELNDELVEKLEAIKDKHYLSFLSATVRFIIGRYYEEFLENGNQRKPGRPAFKEEQIIEQVQKKVFNKETKKEIMEKAKNVALIEMATKPWPIGLNGTISTDGKTVTYWTYFERGRDERTILLSEVSKDYIESQYQPSHEEITRMQEAGSVDY